jgi:hypothetical protein
MYLTKNSGGLNIVNIEYKLYVLRLKHIQEIILNRNTKGLGAIRAKIGPTSDVDNFFSKMYSQYVLFINKYS